MFQITRINASRFVAFQARNFTVAPALAAKAATPKTKKTITPELKTLQKALEKEKTVLDKLRLKIKKVEASGKAKKAQTAEKKREEKALGPFKKLSPLNMFIKENYHKTGSLAKTSQEWTQLAEGEKEAYAQKAEKYNAENLKLYIPKPTHPTPAYAKFTKTFWEDNGDFGASSKAASQKWNKLTKEEKQKFNPTPQEWETYRKALAVWKEKRIKIFESKL